MKTIKQNLQKLKSSLGNKPQINIVVVTKTRSPEEIQEAIAAGATSIGENRVQEAEQKFSKIQNIEKTEKRLIGRLQSNKAKKAVGIFDTIDSVDSLKLSQKISKAAEDLGKTQRVLLQINSSGENTKAGFSLNSKKEILECINMSGIEVEGLMTMGPNTQAVDLIAKSFQKTKKLFDELNELENVKMKTLSMGMSGDYLIAVREGSTSIRVGTAIFGPRV
jgi:pyridoxal phosphate enzyme (YggS family)